MPKKRHVLITVPRAAERIGVSVSTLRRLVERGDLMPPLQLSRNRVAFLLQDVEAYLNSRTRAWTSERMNTSRRTPRTGRPRTRPGA